LSKSEAKILDTLLAIESGNAYGLWKTSGLKHYPTVLRAVKKLKEKRLIKDLSESGTRGEKIYIPTLFGTLLHYALRDEENRIAEIISQKSRLFKELLDSKIEQNSHFLSRIILRYMVYDVLKGKSPIIDDLIKDIYLDFIRDNVSNIDDSKSKNELKKLSKVEWLRNFIIEDIEREINYNIKQNQELKKLKATLTTE